MTLIFILPIYLMATFFIGLLNAMLTDEEPKIDKPLLITAVVGTIIFIMYHI
jgi:hypothetical protein